MDLAITFSGPFLSASFMDAAPYPQIPEASESGIYLQAVRLESGYRVRYVGETGTSFLKRLVSAFKDWLSGKDTPSGATLELDSTAYRKGIFSRNRPRDAEWQKRRKEILDDTLVFLAPLPVDVEMGVRRQVEAALVRKIVSSSAEAAQFLYNQPLRTRQFDGILTIKVSNGVKIEGVDGRFRDTVM